MEASVDLTGATHSRLWHSIIGFRAASGGGGGDGGAADDEETRPGGACSPDLTLRPRNPKALCMMPPSGEAREAMLGPPQSEPTGRSERRRTTPLPECHTAA